MKKKKKIDIFLNLFCREIKMPFRITIYDLEFSFSFNRWKASSRIELFARYMNVHLSLNAIIILMVRWFIFIIIRYIVFVVLLWITFSLEQDQRQGLSQ